jgi:hypothetical protein
MFYIYFSNKNEVKPEASIHTAYIKKSDFIEISSE